MDKQYQRAIKSSHKPKYNRPFFCLRILLIILWYLLAIVLSVILRFTATSDYPLVYFGHCIVCHSSLYGYFWLPFGIFWPLYCLSFFALRLLLIILWYLLDITLSVILRFTATSDYPLVSFGHCIVCHSSVYSYFWLPFAIFWPLHNDRQCNVQKIPKDNQKEP
jgi:hypothetical protein